MALWQAWAERLQHWQWIGMLLARLAVGLLFMLSGGGKLFSPTRREQMRQALIAARNASPTLVILKTRKLGLVVCGCWETPAKP